MSDISIKAGTFWVEWRSNEEKGSLFVNYSVKLRFLLNNS